MVLFLVALVAGPVLAQDPIVYPAKGQSEEQMEKDKFDCYTWAKKQTGFDPMKVPEATEAPPREEGKKGGLLKGALGGAALGAAVGAIAGDAGAGAGIGAATGGLFGSMRRKNQVENQQQAEQEWAQEQTAQYAQRRDGYNRAYDACLEGRGYTVK
jgi:hypothetical protein